MLRYSAMRQLDWSRSYSYQSKDVDAAQEQLSRRLAQSVIRTWEQVKVSGGDPWRPLLAFYMLSFCSHGGGRGDDIRLEILDIMRRRNIREGHRPGIEDRFLEQWRQKLHQNTSPDDIAIASAYIAFLERCYPPPRRGV